MDRGAWRATVCGVAESRTQLSKLTQTQTWLGIVLRAAYVTMTLHSNSEKQTHK